MRKIIKLLNYFPRRERLRIIRAQRRLRDLQMQSELKRQQYRILEDHYSRERFKRGKAGEIRVLPEEIRYQIFSNELQTLTHRITGETIRHFELDNHWESLKRRYIAMDPEGARESIKCITAT